MDYKKWQFIKFKSFVNNINKMLEKCEEGSMEMLCIEDESQDFLGLAIFVLYKDFSSPCLVVL